MNTKTKVAEQEVAQPDLEAQSTEGQELVLEEKESTEIAESANHPIAQSESLATLSMIERAATNPEVDMDKFERLMQMKERIEDKAAEKLFNQSMAAAQSEMGVVLKTQRNDHTKSNYADLGVIIESIKPIYTLHGFSVSFNTEPSEVTGCFRMVVEVAHNGGFTKRYTADLALDTTGAQGTSNKTSIQGWGSTASYGRRYMLLLIFNIALGSEDNDGNQASNQQELSTAATDWIAKLQEATTLEELQSSYREAYTALDGDGLGRNKLMKAKDAVKKTIGRS